MGLDTSHNCWHGAYSAFMRWRKMIAHLAGLPPLELMEGFFKSEGDPCNNPFWESFNKDKASGYNEGKENIWNRLPIRWDALKPSALHILLHHSDCDGELDWKDCAPIADELEKLLPLFPQNEAGGHIGNWRDKTQTFITGLRLAASKQENVEFH